MGHSIHYATYDEKTNKNSIQAYWDDYAAHEDWEEGCCGLPNNIRWIDHICDDYDEAHEYIENHDRQCYDQLAVKYREYPEMKKTKTLETLEERAKRLCDRYHELANNIHYANVKSQFIGCKHCGSKIASPHIKSNRCPVCYTDLRPESTLDTIKRAKANYEKAQNDVKVEIKKIQEKQKKQAKIKWLVKVEFHV